MSFIPKTWVDDQIVYAEDMNRIEQGISDAVSVTPQTLSDEQKIQVRQNINAAPAGYGLGETFGRYVLDCDSADKFGIYLTSSSTANAPTLYGTLLVIPRYTSSELQATVQIYFPASSSGAGNISQRCYLIREREQAGTWKDWEWVNPPFITDTVYRTIERQFGNPVYKKMDSDGVIWCSTDQSTWKREAERVGAYTKGETNTLLTGKAPAGYGLGTSAQEISTDWNEAISNGWWREGNDRALNRPFPGKWAIGFTANYTEASHNTQTAYYIESGGEVYQKIRGRDGRNGTWGPWEWVNPPMEPGVEYRTTERFYSNPVYVKVFKFYPWPADGSITSLNIEGINRIVRAEVSTGIGVIGPGKTTSRMGFDVALSQNYLGGTDTTWNGAIKTYGSNPYGGENYLKIYYTKG